MYYRLKLAARDPQHNTFRRGQTFHCRLTCRPNELQIRDFSLLPQRS